MILGMTLRRFLASLVAIGLIGMAIGADLGHKYAAERCNDYRAGPVGRAL